MRAPNVFLAAALVCLVSCSETGKKVTVKEVVFDSAVADIQWLGADQRTVLVQTSKGRLYRSTNKGEKWNDITDQLKASLPSSDASATNMVIDRIIKSPAEEGVNHVLVIGAHRNHFISTDAGGTWKLMKAASTIHTFMFHKTKAKWALLSTWTPACDKNKVKKEGGDDDDDDESPCNHMLYITKDLGKTFNLVTSYVVQFSWGDVFHKQQDLIYFTHFRQKTGDQPKLYIWSQNVDFAYTDDFGKTKHRLVQHGNKFMVSHSFIFVAKLNDFTAQTVNLACSSNGGYSFQMTKLPQDLAEKSYTVLDTSEGAVMLHVNHGSNVGNVYISDQKGVRYTLSLPNNVRSDTGNCEFDKVLSLEGVYMANQHKGAGGVKVTHKQGEAAKEADELEEEETAGTEVDKRRSTKSKSKDETIIRTVISFDKGGVWSFLKAPKVDSLGKKIDCPPSRCWLHLHGITNFHNYAPFYSTENAIGIIMGTGNVGPYLRFEPDQTNTYLSRDGGLSWVEAHKGAFIYEFGDHGGLMVMADDIRKTKQVVFSWNEGESWYDFEVSDYPMEVDNIVTEPNATSTKFLLYGTRGDTGVMYYLDFETLGQPICKGVWAADSVSSDYETWTPSDGRSVEKCMLGRQVTYTRRKKVSECFNGEKFERPVVRKNCECTQENFECEMGFKRQIESLECQFANDGVIPVPAKCANVDIYFLDGYRKVVGDTCEGGWQPQKVQVSCPPKVKLTRGAMSVLSTILMVGGFMGGITLLSKSEKFKGWFANYGFENFNSVKYSSIGAKCPETALDSVGTREFIEEDQDEFMEDPPQLMAYIGNRGGDRSRRGESDTRREAPRGIDTAAARVPKLQKPPGATSAATTEDDDGLDLL